MNNDTDPDFDIASSVGAATYQSNTSSRLLRSVCHDYGPCHEGHGIQFHSRISPSPSRSSLRLRSRRRRRSQSGNQSSVLENSPTLPEEEENKMEETPKRLPKIDMNLSKSSVRRDLNEDLARVERTSGWVADLPPMETRILRLNTSTKKTIFRNSEAKIESSTSKTEERIVYDDNKSTSSDWVLKTPPKRFNFSPLSTSSASGSPRLRVFDGETWKKSPRTGYTYVNSACYRNNWTPDREVPMPHMARRPLDEYNDGEVSFQYSSSYDNSRLFDNFSSDDEIEGDTTNVQSVQDRRMQNSESRNRVASVFYSLLTLAVSVKSLVLYTFATLFKHAFSVKSSWHAINESAVFSTALSFLKWSLRFIIIEVPTNILPLFIPSHVANLASVAEAFEKSHPETDSDEEVQVIKKKTYFLHDIYNWTTKKTSSQGEKRANISNNAYNGQTEHDEKSDVNNVVVEEVFFIKKIIWNILDIYIWTTKSALKSASLISRFLSRTTKVALNAPKALILLLVPSILTNNLSHAQNYNGISSNFANKNTQQNGILIEEQSQITRIFTENFHDVYTWTKRGTFAAVQHFHVPDVRSAIRTLGGFLTGILFSLLVLLNPKTWISKLPKISRKRIRHWRKKRRSRGPPTRFSARIRKLPVQFTGELPVTRRTRRPKTVLIVPQEPKESRIERIMNEFEKRVSEFKPSALKRTIAAFASKLGYFQEEEVEIRRSARLRGLNPEYEGLEDSKKSRRPRKSLAFDPDLTDFEDHAPLHELVKPRRRSILASIFACFGFYDEEEIRRRRSLRLQGLDPEFEGLAWGPRRRGSRKQKSKFWPALFGDYHDDDEVFFEYHDEEEGFFQRWIDKILHLVGYLQFEDVHEHPEELEEKEIIEQNEEEFKNDMHNEESDDSDEEEEEEGPGYVEIPSDSFIKAQNQLEASYDNSYQFEATEGVFNDSEYYQNDIKITQDKNSCLGIILVLSIPLLLLASLAILDSNVKEIIDKSVDKVLTFVDNVFTLGYSSIYWPVLQYCAVIGQSGQSLVLSLMSFVTSGLFFMFNNVFIALVHMTNWIWSVFVLFTSVFSSASISMKSENIVGIPDVTETIADKNFDEENVNYENIALNFVENEKFLTLLQKTKFGKTEQESQGDIAELIENNFEEMIGTLNLKQDYSMLESELEILKADKMKDYQDNLNEKAKLRLEMQAALENFQSRMESREINAETSIQSLKADLDTVEKDLAALILLVKKCCDQGQDQILDKNAILTSFLDSHKDQYVTKEDFRKELFETINSIQTHITENSKKDLNDLIDLKLSQSSQKFNNLTILQSQNTDLLNKAEIEEVIKSALLTYGADKTGAFDFALETAGGSIVSTRCTQMYTARLPQYTWFGLPLWLPLPIWGPATNPRTAIQPGVMPGECWAFKGQMGFLVIKLAMPMTPTRFSLEHIPKSLSPNGKIDSAPKDFLVLGLQQEKDEDVVELGQFTYDADGEPLQFFNVVRPSEGTFSYVELRILNNHGNSDYTCLYRFRVHGSP